MTDHRASFDAAITFGNGGDLVVHGFRVDLPSSDAGESEIAALFVASLGLLMTDEVRLANVRIFAEPHKGTRGGPSDRPPPTLGPMVELDRVSPARGPVAESDRESPASGPGARSEGVPLEGTLIEAPGSLSALPLTCVADLPAVVVRVAGAGQRLIDVGMLAAFDVRGAAVLLHTGAPDGFSLTPAAASWLTANGAALVGTDGSGRRDEAGPGDAGPAGARRSARRMLLDAGVPVVEGLTGLERLPPTGAVFSAVPPRVESARAPVRAFARLPL
ncbi:hypothetical protein [Nonomuraea sp. NPDC048916]|uniref:hypothetical protein n=1 Tax=Nonomuraea sp. NPDC048916 TaxID=3154232 RepID=UPI0033E4427F